MAESIVIDASIAIALVRHEPWRTAIWAATRKWAEARNRLLVPALFWVEVVNALVRKHHRTEAEVIEALATLDELAIETIELDRPTLLLALVSMSQAGLSAYDALYVALATSTESHLATLDRRLAAVAGSRAVLFAEGGPGRVAGSPAGYERGADRAPAWVRSAAVGAHIAELRRRAIVAGG